MSRAVARADIRPPFSPRWLRACLWLHACRPALILLLLIARVGEVSAQESAQVLASRALFDEGRRLMEAGDLATACEKFEESQSLRPGIGTQFNLADCYEKTGRIASAWSLYLSVAAETRSLNQPEREQVARTRADALRPRLSHLTLKVGSPAPGLVIELDGTEMNAATWGVATPLDPGDHSLSARAPGYDSWSGVASIPASAEEVIVEIPALSPEAPVPAATPAHSSHASPPDSDRLTTSRKGPYIVGAVGITGVVLGGLLGLRAVSKNGEAEKICEGRETRCLDDEIREHDQLEKAARNARSAGYASFGLGLVGVGVSAVWLLSLKDDPRGADAMTLRPVVGRHDLGVGLSGQF